MGVADGPRVDRVTPGQGTAVAGVSPAPSMPAVAVTILKIEPGGYWPDIAMVPWGSAAAFCATSRISPVDGWMATITAGGDGATAASAACCIAESSVRVTFRPGTAGCSANVVISAPVVSTVAIRQPGAGHHLGGDRGDLTQQRFREIPGRRQVTDLRRGADTGDGGELVSNGVEVVLAQVEHRVAGVGSDAMIPASMSTLVSVASNWVRMAARAVAVPAMSAILSLSASTL